MIAAQAQFEKDQERRIAAKFSDAELARIDDWGFARKIRDRSTVIRKLVELGLSAAPAVESMTAGQSA